MSSQRAIKVNHILLNSADLVERLLQVVLSDRLPAYAALDHPFTAEYRNFLDDSKSDSFFDFRWQHEIRTIDDARRSAYNHIMKTANLPTEFCDPLDCSKKGSTAI